MRHLLNLFVLSGLLLAATPSLAAPAEIAATIHAEAPYGTGDAGVLFLTAYKASLWTDAPSWSMEAPFALSVTYAMNFDTDELVSRTIKEMKHVDPGLSEADTTRWTPQLNKVFPPVKKGERITAFYAPGKPVIFYKDGKETGSIADAAFAKDFFGIWLSPQTSDPALRTALLKSK